MIGRHWAVLLLLTLLAGCGDQAPRLERLGAEDIVLAFGDSLTYGTGAKAEESYPAVLSQLIGRAVVSAGVPGEVTAGGLARLADVLDTHRPRLVLLCLGGNDFLRRSSLTEAEANLRAMLKIIRARGIDAVLIGVPQPVLIAKAPDFYEKLAREFRIPYEGRVIASVLYAPEFKSDPAHPNAAGYRRIAETLAQLLRASGAL